MGNNVAMGDKLFALIDINNNGKLSSKEVGAFLFCVFGGAENDNERDAAKFLTMMFMSVAEANGLGDDGEITKQMLDDAPEPEDVPEGVQAGMESIFMGMEQAGEEQVKAMLKQAAEMSDDELGEFLKDA